MPLWSGREASRDSQCAELALPLVESLVTHRA